jgi:hypothetical protein
MMRKFLVYTLIVFLFLVAYNSMDILAQDESEGLPPSPGMNTTSRVQKVYGIVGKVDYTEFRSRGESKIVVKDKKGEKLSVSLDQVEPGATILATYRKEQDKKGREKNVLVSLSIVKPVQSKSSGRRR